MSVRFLFLIIAQEIQTISGQLQQFLDGKNAVSYPAICGMILIPTGIFLPFIIAQLYQL